MKKTVCLSFLTALSAAPAFAADGGMCANLPTGEADAAVYQTLHEIAHRDSESEAVPFNDPKVIRAAQVALCRTDYVGSGIGGIGPLVRSNSVAYAILYRQPDAAAQFAGLFRSSTNLAPKMYALAALSELDKPLYHTLRGEIDTAQDVGYATTDEIDSFPADKMLQFIEDGWFKKFVLSPEFCQRTRLCG